MSKTDFARRVQKNGVKLKNISNVEYDDGIFRFSDYVAKDPMSWSYVPENPDEVDVEEIAEEMYDIYENLDELFNEVVVQRDEGPDMYWVEIEVKVPEDPSRRERIAEQVSESILSRQQI